MRRVIADQQPLTAKDVQGYVLMIEFMVEYTQSQKFAVNNLDVKFLFWTLPLNWFVARPWVLKE